MTAQPQRRLAARVLLVDAARRVLLLSVCDPSEPARHPWWELPGGAIEEGEDAAHAACRELLEETGIRLDPAAVGPCVWRRRAAFWFNGRVVDQEEWIYLAWLPDGTQQMMPARCGVEALALRETRWWPLDQLAGSEEEFVPAELPGRILRVLGNVLGNSGSAGSAGCSGSSSGDGGAGERDAPA